tara:strand:+ start:3197 stop:4066 length:870 start_codon:yes stop_codon:yes gene_type:complete
MLKPGFLAISLSFLAFLFVSAPALAQDDFSLPGDEEPVLSSQAVKDAEAASAADRNLLDMLKEGGWAMWPLGLMSIAIITLAIFLITDLTKSKFTPEPLVAQLSTAMANGDVVQGMELASNNSSCLGRVMNGALEYTAKRGYHVLDGDTVYDLMADASQISNRGRAKTINYLSVISQAAPMVGLLGTVSGMIKAFATLSSGGMGDPGKLAGNISEALMTTATGLVVALPAIFLYFAFRDKLADGVSQTEIEASKLLNTLRDVIFAQYEQAEAQAAAEPAVPGQPPAPSV